MNKGEIEEAGTEFLDLVLDHLVKYFKTKPKALVADIILFTRNDNAREITSSWGYKSAMLVLDAITYHPTLSEGNFTLNSDFVSDAQYETIKNIISYSWKINEFTSMNLRDIFNDIKLFIAMKDPLKIPDYGKQFNQIMNYVEDARRLMHDY